MSSIISLKGVHKSFEVGQEQVAVLKDINLEVQQGEFTIIFGPSGSGKSTLLHTILGLEPCTRGKVFLDGKDLYSKTSEDERSFLRKQLIGSVFQNPQWIMSLSVLENVAFPLLLLGKELDASIDKAQEALRMVKMEHKAQYRLGEISSGQQEKVAVARAVINDPKLIIADEPTGNLDSESGTELMKLLKELNQKSGKNILMVTHDLVYLDYASTAIQMVDGEIVKRISQKEKGKLQSDQTLNKKKK